MKKTTDITSLRKAALAAGLGFLGILALFLFVNFLVVGGLIEHGDGVATSRNVADNELLFKSGIAAFMVLTMLDLVVTWGLFVFLRPVSKTLSVMSSLFRLLATAVLAAVTVNLINVEHLVASGKPAAEIGGQVELFANAFVQGWQLALGFYGVHFLLLGYMAIRARYMPNWLGALVVIAGAGYFYDSFASVFTSGEAELVANVTFVGEVLLIFWLLVKGSRLKDK